MVPTKHGGADFMKGNVVKTNDGLADRDSVALWHCVFNNGWVQDLEECEVRAAIWLHRCVVDRCVVDRCVVDCCIWLLRCVVDGWETGQNSGQGMVGKRVSRADKTGQTVGGQIVATQKDMAFLGQSVVETEIRVVETGRDRHPVPPVDLRLLVVVHRLP